MDFKEFVRRMLEKYERGGFVFSEDENDPEYKAFLDRASEIFAGLMIYSEFVNEQAIEQMEKERAKLKARMQSQGPSN